jgi:GNAT superfamily N-acetyltransferase
LGSNSCETYLAIVENAPAGFAVLVIDEPLWNVERMARYGTVSLRAIAALQRPLHGLRLAAKHMRLVVARSASAPQGPELSRPAGDRAFLGTIGVVPERRRTGIARVLMEVREARARQLGRAMAWCMIDPGNLAAERFHAAMQYCQVCTSPLGTTWERPLS